MRQVGSENSAQNKQKVRRFLIVTEGLESWCWARNLKFYTDYLLTLNSFTYLCYINYVPLYPLFYVHELFKLPICTWFNILRSSIFDTPVKVNVPLQTKNHKTWKRNPILRNLISEWNDFWRPIKFHERPCTLYFVEKFGAVFKFWSSLGNRKFRSWFLDFPITFSHSGIRMRREMPLDIRTPM